MCGIAGFTAPGREAEAVLAQMTRALAHCGPDASGVFVDDRIALGHRRLAIIDLAGGAQPRVDRTTGDALVFNGEIYGYRTLADELRGADVILRDRSDTEVLFQLIRRIGLHRAVERIDGMRGRPTPLLLRCDTAPANDSSAAPISRRPAPSGRRSNPPL